MRDVRGTVWNVRDIPIGATVQSDRTQLGFFINGRYHLLQFGPWALGDCREEYVYGYQINGRGTTAVNVQRLDDSEFRFSTPPGAIGRLWEWARGQAPIDRGLYHFSFDVRLSPVISR